MSCNSLVPMHRPSLNRERKREGLGDNSRVEASRRNVANT